MERGTAVRLKPGVKAPNVESIPPGEMANRLIVGAPEKVLGQLRDYEALGLEEFVVSPLGSQQQVIETMRLLARDVIPHFATSRGRVVQARADRGGRVSPEAAEAAIRSRYALPADWRAWEPPQWLRHIQAVAARNDPRQAYIFDFAYSPTVKGGIDTYVDGERTLSRVIDVGCPECGRPVVIMFHRRNQETIAQIREIATRMMRESDWHSTHAPVQAASPVGAAAR
jgi:hypothetical protein